MFIMICIISNIIVMAMNYEGESKYYGDILE